MWDVAYQEKSEFERACKLAGKELRGLTYQEAIREAFIQGMEEDPTVFIMGEGVDHYGWIFGTTKGLVERFGKERVFDTPIAENTITGVAIGAALCGMKPVVVHMRMDFLLMAMDQIVNQAAKWRYMFGGKVNVPLVICTIIGRGWGSAAQHSQSLQAYFIHTPGLKVVMPSTPYDVKGLFMASLKERGPVIFIEARFLYNHMGYVPEEAYSVPLGRGTVRREGKDITIVATSYMVFESIQAAEALKEKGIELEVIDPRTIKPLDEELILESVKKTGRLVIADTGHRSGGLSAEIAAIISEKGYSYLKAPIKRVALSDVPTPASPILEKKYYPSSAEIIKAVEETLIDNCKTNGLFTCD